jgi:uncharacterized membrane protein YoaK (UPF0700 family)
MAPVDLANYWKAVARVVPVLALALVLAARTIARRHSKEQQLRAARRRRIAWALTYFVLAVLLATTETMRSPA